MFLVGIVRYHCRCYIFLIIKELVLYPIGNNIYGDDIPKILSGTGSDNERTAYILMERIHPSTLHNYPVFINKTTQKQLVGCELGIFGSLVG